MPSLFLDALCLAILITFYRTIISAFISAMPNDDRARAIRSLRSAHFSVDTNTHTLTISYDYRTEEKKKKDRRKEME